MLHTAMQGLRLMVAQPVQYKLPSQKGKQQEEAPMGDFYELALVLTTTTYFHR